jgi:hypothetical protein
MPVRQHSERGRAVLITYRYASTASMCTSRCSERTWQCELNGYIDIRRYQYASTSALHARQGSVGWYRYVGTPVRQHEEHYTEDGSDAINTSVINTSVRRYV